ncbi:MAG: glutathione S-transferase family protein [Kordiimonadaceae bacterium]|nr:glutathione S-transferase family protein [Kordiimonadaceae bacterium]
MTMQLCGMSASPYFERVMVVLDIKGVLADVSYPGVPGGFKSVEHTAHHPKAMIPYLIKEDGSSLTEGQLIAEYLDHKLGGPTLLPADIDKAMQVRAICRIFDLYYYPAQRPVGAAYFGGEVTEAEIAKARNEDIPAAFRYIEKYMDDGEYAVGNSWSVADAVLMTQLYWYERAIGHEGIHGFFGCKRMEAYWDNIQKTDIAKCSVERVEKAYNQIFGGPGTSFEAGEAE